MMTNNFIVANTIIKGEWSSVLNKLSFFECDDYDLKNAITGIALKSESGKVNDLLRSKPIEKPEDYSFTKLYENKTIKNLIDVFELETTRIRIFKQEPNHETSLHVDYNNTNSSKEDYLVRIWMALNSNDNFKYFFKDKGILSTVNLKKGQSVIFNPDTVYHGAANNSNENRYSLNIIAKPNEWLRHFAERKETIII